MLVYRFIFRHWFVHVDPERAHHLAYALIGLAGRVAPLRFVIKQLFGARPGRSVALFGREVPGPLGVAAGFDKQARAVRGLTMLGFSHVEVGTVTSLAQVGNPRPRLWRLVEDEALRNQMGFNNDGAARVARRLARLRSTAAGRAAVVGVNIGKSKRTPLNQAAADYQTSARLLAKYADYVVVNVSSPNTPGLRDLQATQSLRPVLTAARQGCDQSTGRDSDITAHRVPLLVKVAPDLADADIDQIANLVLELGLDGVVAVNTTIGHSLGAGGLSGPPLRERGLEVVRRLRQRLGPEPIVIGVGGISTADDVKDYRRAGANLVQAYTAFIYQGPAWPGRINRAVAGLELV